MTKALDGSERPPCQECGGEIIFPYGHSPGEYFCSGECQMAADKKQKEKWAKEALKK